ncbi:hypothetical protein [Bacillus toyonensis]|uniref:DUF4145 domain-containing protein n=1 Tax=Bacillus toyonensis TaxID=155322 RepID=A0A2B5Y7S3_9BACI|nr:hypothetical protein [Bacillus toyonensis]PGB04696.1 hypothetical protein COL93_00835 [Bacillus toyonensis]PHD66951.1 hypothetical protein COF40_20485 [Bacillus toyonensis]
MQSTNYYIEHHLKEEFECPHCEKSAKQLWFAITQKPWEDPKVYPLLETSSWSQVSNISFDRDNSSESLTKWKFEMSTCDSCMEYIIWINERPLLRDSKIIPLPHESMPNNVKQLYNVARNVFFDSHIAANILLKSALKELFQYIERNKLSINLDTSLIHTLKSLEVLEDEGPFSSFFNNKEAVKIEKLTLIMFDSVNLIAGHQVYAGQKEKELHKKLNLLLCK